MWHRSGLIVSHYRLVVDMVAPIQRRGLVGELGGETHVCRCYPRTTVTEQTRACALAEVPIDADKSTCTGCLSEKVRVRSKDIYCCVPGTF